MLAFVLALAMAIDSDPQFREAQKHVDAFEYDKAAALFEEIAKRSSLTGSDRAQVLIWLGLTYAELRDEARASIVFEDAVSADPLIVLPRDASPKIKSLLEDARARVRLRPKQQQPPPEEKKEPPPPPPPPPPEQSGGMGPVAIGTAIVGGVVALAGGTTWGIGLALRQQAEEEPFQSEASKLRDQSLATQIGGQIATGVGAVALAVGVALLFVE